MDEKVTLQCRVQDVLLMEKAIPAACNEYIKASGSRCSVHLDTQTYLSADCAGGVVATSINGRIRCDNTLETRLEQAFEMMLPNIRVRLFGHSENRKFFD